MSSSTVILCPEPTACQDSQKASVRRVNNWCHWFGKRKMVTLPLYDLSAPIRVGPKGARSKCVWGGISWVVLPGDPQTVSADKIYTAQFQVLL